MPDGSLRAREGPVRVGVLVALEWRPDAGGHVKCWEKLASAALARPHDLDLTVHFLGEREGCRHLGPNVRYRIQGPAFGTDRLPFLSGIPAHTDLAPYHRRLAAWLAGYDVVHTTDAFFSFARTAERVAARTGIPLVNSIHTDTPRYQRVFVRRLIEQACGRGAVTRLLLDRLRLGEWAENRALAALDAHHRACAHVFASTDEGRQRAARLLSAGSVGLLGRGVDLDFYHPGRRDRPWLESRFGLPLGRTVVLHVGRLDPTKNVLLLARAVRSLAQGGRPVHLLCVGDGEDRAAIQAMLGEHATCPGFMPPDILARVFASSDLFAFPSAMDVFGNAPLEAMASGLPVLVSRQGGMGRILVDGESGLVVGAGTAAWTEALAGLCAATARRQAMGRAARRHAERTVPTWDSILAGSLLPVWQRLARPAPATLSPAG